MVIHHPLIDSLCQYSINMYNQDGGGWNDIDFEHWRNYVQELESGLREIDEDFFLSTNVNC